MMENIETGYIAGPISGESTKGLFDPRDAMWMLLIFIAIWGGDEIKQGMMNAVAEKAKEVIARGEQSVSEAEKFAEHAE